jgi:transcription-repair coupling factor (superfamily II helicase)
VPDLNLPIRGCAAFNLCEFRAVRLAIYGRVARCRSDEDLDDLLEETARRFGRLPHAARDFFAASWPSFGRQAERLGHQASTLEQCRETAICP